jgi:Asp-tRNA(Asn)/Glu-tRNA(Gln) amidotransferase A subunit family amidase
VWTQFALARDAGDLAALFALLSTAPRPGARVAFDTPQRVGLVDHDPIIGLTVHADVAAGVRHLGRALEGLGHHVEFSYPPAFERLFRPFWKATEVIGPFARAEQVAWMERRLGRSCVPGDLSEEFLDAVQRGAALSADEVEQAHSATETAMREVTTWWGHHDLLVTPVMLEPPWLLGEAAPIRTGMFAAPFSYTGQPALMVPVALSSDGLPIGMQIVGRPGDDEALLALAVELQEALCWPTRHPPRQ